MALGDPFQMAGVVLPRPQRWQPSRVNRATRYRGVDGTVITDRRAGVAQVYQDVVVQWEAALPSEAVDIEAAWTAMAELGSVAMVDVAGQSRTAYFNPEAPAITLRAYRGMRADSPAFQTLYQVTFSMRIE
jgi:hypothetical protein